MRDFIASFYLSKPDSSIAGFALTWTLALLALVSLAACRRQSRESVRQASTPELLRLRANLALVPAEARIVMSLDLDRLRTTALGRNLLSGPAKEAGLLAGDFAKGTGLDPLEQARQVLIAVPGERQDDDRLVLVAEFRALDRMRATAWLGERRDGKTAAFVVGPDRIVIATGAWAAEVASLAKPTGRGQSADDDEELRRLCERSAGPHVFWLAAVLPTPLRHRLMAETRFPDVASLARLSAALDVEAGLRADIVGELSNEADARSLAHRLSAFLNAAKHHPDMLAQGLAPYLDAVRLGAQGPNLNAHLELPAAQAEDLVLRAGDLLHPR